MKFLPTKTLLWLEPTILDVIGSLWGRGSTELSHLHSLNTKEKTYYSTGNELPLDTEARASSASRYSSIIPVKFCILVLQADLETSEDPNWKWFSGSTDTLKGFFCLSWAMLTILDALVFVRLISRLNLFKSLQRQIFAFERFKNDLWKRLSDSFNFDLGAQRRNENVGCDRLCFFALSWSCSSLPALLDLLVH